MLDLNILDIKKTYSIFERSLEKNIHAVWPSKNSDEKKI